MSFSYGIDERFTKAGPPAGAGAVTHADTVAVGQAMGPRAGQMPPPTLTKDELEAIRTASPDAQSQITELLTQGLPKEQLATAVRQVMAKQLGEALPAAPTTMAMAVSGAPQLPVVPPTALSESVAAPAMPASPAPATAVTTLTTGRHAQTFGSPSQENNYGVTAPRMPYRDLGDSLAFIASLERGFSPQAGLPGRSAAIQTGRLA